MYWCFILFNIYYPLQFYDVMIHPCYSCDDFTSVAAQQLGRVLGLSTLRAAPFAAPAATVQWNGTAYEARASRARTSKGCCCTRASRRSARTHGPSRAPSVPARRG